MKSLNLSIRQKARKNRLFDFLCEPKNRLFDFWCEHIDFIDGTAVKNFLTVRQS